MRKNLAEVTTKDLMFLRALRDRVIERYGEDSHEAGFIQYVFSNRDTEYFLAVYKDYMKESFVA